MERERRFEHLATVGLVIMMVLVGALGWWLQLGPQVRLDASPLANVPTRIGGWDSRDIPISNAVEAELRADFNLQRTYIDRLGHPVWLYVGYYGTERGGRPEHTPRGCYTGAGWGIEVSRVLDVTADGSLRVNEYLVHNSEERRLVHFWYRSHRRTGLLGGLDQNLDRLIGRLFDRRADGALVRVSTPILDDDSVAARGRLLAFSVLLDPLLAENWPIETPCSEPESAGCAFAPSAAGAEHYATPRHPRPWNSAG